MNKEWSELNKLVQQQIKKKDTFSEGIQTLFELRRQVMEEILQFKSNLSKEQFCAIPFMNANGYHNKTIAYSLYHIFRIEDIVAHTVIKKDEQIFFKYDYQQKMHSPIVTTGNELVKQEIAEFSKQLDIEELYHYINDVDASTKELLQDLTYVQLKDRFTDKEKEAIRDLGVVSSSEDAVWLIDYWCDKDIKGLIQMPFSRHWIMHVEAALRIEKKI